MKSKQLPTKKDVMVQVDAWDLVIHKPGRSWKQWPGFTYGKRHGAVEAATAVEKHFASLGFLVEHRTPSAWTTGSVRFLGRAE